MEMIRAQEQDIILIEKFYKQVAVHQIACNEKQWDEADITWDALTSVYSLSDFYLYKVQDQIVAACLIVDHDPIYWPEVPKHTSLYLHKLAVLPAQRKLGVGDEVVRFFITQGYLHHVSEVCLDVRAYKQKLRTFYEHNGFTLVRIASILEDYDTALYHYRLEDENE